MWITGEYTGEYQCSSYPTFQLAVRDDIIRKNPTDGAYADVSITMNIYAEVNESTTRDSIEKLAKNLDVF